MAKSKGRRPNRIGRRPGPSSTREEILRAARRRFAQHGYDRATFRNIAADAGVDPALVVQFFGSKKELFTAATATPEVTFAELVARADPDMREGAGLRLAQVAMRWLDDPDSREAIVARIRSAASEETAADLVRKTVGEEISAIAGVLGGDRPDVRARLLGATFVGLIWTRYVVPLEPLASMTADEVAAWLGPTFQLYLDGQRGSGSAGGPA